MTNEAKDAERERPEVDTALREAALAIYFGDSADYIRALWSVVRALCPPLVGALEHREEDVFGRIHREADALASAPGGGVENEATRLADVLDGIASNSDFTPVFERILAPSDANALKASARLLRRLAARAEGEGQNPDGWVVTWPDGTLQAVMGLDGLDYHTRNTAVAFHWTHNRQPSDPEPGEERLPIDSEPVDRETAEMVVGWQEPQPGSDGTLRDEPGEGIDTTQTYAEQRAADVIVSNEPGEDHEAPYGRTPRGRPKPKPEIIGGRDEPGEERTWTRCADCGRELRGTSWVNFCPRGECSVCLCDDCVEDHKCANPTPDDGDVGERVEDAAAMIRGSAWGLMEPPDSEMPPWDAIASYLRDAWIDVAKEVADTLGVATLRARLEQVEAEARLYVSKHANLRRQLREAREVMAKLYNASNPSRVERGLGEARLSMLHTAWAEARAWLAAAPKGEDDSDDSN